jgi:putative membrane protein
MVMRAESFFSEQESARIAAAVREVELRTSGEVAVMVVDASDSYPEGRILAGAVLGGLSALGITDFFLAGELWLFVPLALALTALCGWLSGYLPGLHRFFIPAVRLEQQVTEQALIDFYQKGLHLTRDATGVLFFISLFEHKVRVMADRGIYEKISQQTLQRYADQVALGIKTGRASEALILEIRRVGEILAEHFPPRHDDENELDNEVIVGR